MIEQARNTVAIAKTETCKTKFEFGVDNGTSLDNIADDSVDIVVSSFAVFMIPDTKAVLEQVRRVLRKGGMFGMTAWTQVPQLGPGFGLNFEAVLIESLGLLKSEAEVSKEEKKELGGPWEQWRDGEKGINVLANDGFDDVKVWTSMHTASFANVAKLWNMIVTNPMTDVSMFSKDELESLFNKFKASVLSKAGIGEGGDGDDHMVLLVNAANLFVGCCK